MKGPSIAVMLGGPHGGADEHDDAEEPGLGEVKASAKDAARALASALAAKDPEAIVRSFRALNDLCGGMGELEESGEKDEEKAEGESADSED